MGFYVKNRDLELLMAAQDQIHVDQCPRCSYRGDDGYTPPDCPMFKTNPGRVECLNERPSDK